MKDQYLEITYRKGKPLAAYLYLPRECGAKSVRTERASERILIDYGKDGRVLGLEITDPNGVAIEEINEILQALGQARIDQAELTPLADAH
ncbi:MAG TPA: DUF2283 domain-containing protein [Gemmatimonadota bacterium]|nr:DUF2283 domain-containing protein [Gemmatimonadota bacterium]